MGKRPAYLLHVFQSQTSESLGENSFALTHPYQYRPSSDFYNHNFPRCYSCSSPLHAMFLLHYLSLRYTSIPFYIITYWKNSIFTSVWWILTDTLLPYVGMTGDSMHVKLNSAEWKPNVKLSSNTRSFFFYCTIVFGNDSCHSTPFYFCMDCVNNYCLCGCTFGSFLID